MYGQTDGEKSRKAAHTYCLCQIGLTNLTSLARKSKVDTLASFYTMSMKAEYKHLKYPFS